MRVIIFHVSCSPAHHPPRRYSVCQGCIDFVLTASYVFKDTSIIYFLKLTLHTRLPLVSLSSYFPFLVSRSRDPSKSNRRGNRSSRGFLVNKMTYLRKGKSSLSLEVDYLLVLKDFVPTLRNHEKDADRVTPLDEADQFSSSLFLLLLMLFLLRNLGTVA